MDYLECYRKQQNKDDCQCCKMYADCQKVIAEEMEAKYERFKS